ncbi:5-oxopent-3-ene-1,2,5-tricarboxylate decarboxylase [Ensifer sp. NM-2]|uniref:fumarylacetoacetate hydrolase family protein n=1 Tax=Ensifer sp. NM-2 TaxID=2109730 RepID=UPI000D119DE3|nr:fumarylacetoacetate hydrolase family protein [Ensifer sp. NM-2]PSS60591.1 5-oxopent-3-ene-1,2,5-tricarboxylate decarboxylase [Ensifer sp. NM-2]
MRYASYLRDGSARTAALIDGKWYDVGTETIVSRLQAGIDLSQTESLARGGEFDLDEVTLLPLIATPPKIFCIGLNYLDHAAESPYKDRPSYPAVFPRYATSLVGHGQPIVRPQVSDQLDFEGELVAVIGKGGRHIRKADALSHVAGYSIFNEGSIRDYQFKSPQWTVGKNFDDTGAFGPVLVTADELPPGAHGLKIETRLNGTVMQRGNTADLIFPVAELIATLSEAITLQPGDVIVTGTPAGIGWARKPPVFMKDGDVCEIEIEGIGTLRNPVRDEVHAAAS